MPSANTGSTFFSERVLVVPYERIVMDLEGTARDMLSHCRLPWDESVLHFHKNLRTVQTASLAQVHHRTGIASYLVAPVIADAGLTVKVQQCLCFMAAAAAEMCQFLLVASLDRQLESFSVVHCVKFPMTDPAL